MIRSTVCYEVTCDRGCDGRGWDEGTPHFDTEAEAVDHARSCGFVIVGDTVLCLSCAQKADCERTGHQMPDRWFDGHIPSVPYRYRYCEHCDHCEYDPPWHQILVQVRVAEIVAAADLRDTPPEVTGA